MSQAIQVKWMDSEFQFEIPTQKFDRHAFIDRLRRAFGLSEEKRIFGLTNSSGEMLISDAITPEDLRNLGAKFTLLVSAANNTQASINSKDHTYHGFAAVSAPSSMNGGLTHGVPSNSRVSKPPTSNGETHHARKPSSGHHGVEKLQGNHRVTLQEIFNLESFFSTALNEVKPNTRLGLIKVRSRQELDGLVNHGPSFPEKIKLYYYLQRGESNEKTYFSSELPAYYILGKSKRVSEYPIGPHTDLQEIVSKLDAKKIEQQPNIYIREDFNLIDPEEKSRRDLRSFLKHLERNRLIKDSDFVLLAHWIRFEQNSLAELGESVKKCKSDLDKFAVLKKKCGRNQKSLADSLTHDGIMMMMEDLAKIKLLAPKHLSDLVVCLHGQTSKGKKISQAFSDFLLGKLGIRDLLKQLEVASNTSYNPWSKQRGGRTEVSPIRVQTELVYDLRPESPSPHRNKLSQYLKKSAPFYFKDEELAILEKLYRNNNQYLFWAFELFGSDKDEVEFLDTVRHIITKELANGSDTDGGYQRDCDDRVHLHHTPAKTEELDIRSIGTKDIKLDQPRFSPRTFENTGKKSSSPDYVNGAQANDDEAFVIHSVRTLINEEGQSVHSGTYNNENSSRNPKTELIDTPAFHIEKKEVLLSDRPQVGQPGLKTDSTPTASVYIKAPEQNGMEPNKDSKLNIIDESEYKVNASDLPPITDQGIITSPKPKETSNEPNKVFNVMNLSPATNPLPEPLKGIEQSHQLKKPENKPPTMKQPPSLIVTSPGTSLAMPPPVRVESSPLPSGFAPIPDKLSQPIKQESAPLAPARSTPLAAEQSPNPFRKSVEEPLAFVQNPPSAPVTENRLTRPETVIAASISFCKKGADKDAFFKAFEIANQAKQVATAISNQQPPKQADVKAQSGSTAASVPAFGGFSTEEDSKIFDKARNSIDAPAPAFVSITTGEEGKTANLNNKVDGSVEPDLPRFASGAPSQISNFGNQELESKYPPPSAPVSLPQSQPQIDYRANSQAFVSFRGGDNYRALLKGPPSTIAEQTGEADNSPVKGMKVDVVSGSASPERVKSPPVTLHIDMLGAPDSPGRIKSQHSPRGSFPTNRTYLSQIVKFVLQYDGADSNLAKLCSDLVAGVDGAVTTFSSDILEMSKKRFLKIMNTVMLPIEAEEILTKGELFAEALSNPHDSINAVGDKLLKVREENKTALNESTRVKEDFSKAMYENMKKKDLAQPKSFFMKLTKMDTTVIEVNEMPNFETESKGAKSKASEFTRRDDKRKNENELTEKIYAAMKTLDGKLKTDLEKLIQEARQDGINIDKYQARTMEELLDIDFTSILEILFNYSYFHEYKRVKKALDELLANLSSEAPSAISPRGEHRRSHYLRIKALLKHIRDDTREITTDMFEVFNDLLTRENWGLISAYELFILNENREELIDTLFVIYKCYSGNEIEDVVEDKNKVKQSMEGILFHYKTRFEPKVYDMLVDMVKSRDTKTKELHDQYRIDRDEKKFIAGLTQFSQEKIKRSDEIKKRLEPTAVVDWKQELQTFAETYKTKIPCPNITDFGEIFNMDPDMSRAIFDVYKYGIKDSGDVIENINLLKNRFIRQYIKQYYGDAMPWVWVLLKRGLDAFKALDIIGDYNSSSKTSKTKTRLLEAIQMLEMLEDQGDFFQSVEMIYGLKKKTI